MDTELVGQLPAYGVAAEVNRGLAEHGVVVVTAPPGAGKSTVLPLTLLASLPEAAGRILMLEPRRIAARQIAARMAALLGEPVGQTVGYRIRFERKVSRQTRIEVITEGILTRLLVEDPALEGVAVLIFDEIHERSLQTDLALALARESRAVLRPDLRLLLMSATIDTEAICKQLDAKAVICPGRLFPVEIRHEGDFAAGELVQATLRTVRKAHREEPGDILVFLPGEAEIRRCTEALGTTLAPTQVYPLYGLLSMDEQRRAIAPGRNGERKVVLATPIAETSLTIEGVRVVVDAGCCRKPVFDPRTALERLETVRISRDMAAQRTGRAGRVAAGVCYRLWSPGTESRMQALRRPEIEEADLSPLVLQVAAWGEPQPERLPWLTPPPAGALQAARRVLAALGAIDPAGRITAHGRAMAALPCHPRVAQLLLTAANAAQQALAADIAALLEEKDPLADEPDPDLSLRVEALRRARLSGRPGAWQRIARIASQYRQLAGAEVGEDNAQADPYVIGQLVAAAYPERIAKAWSQGQGRFCLASGDLADAEGTSALSGAQWLAVASVHVRSSAVGRIFLAAPVMPADLLPFAQVRSNLAWDNKAGRVAALRQWRLGVHVLQEKPLTDITRDDTLRTLCEAAPKDGRSMFDFSDEVTQLQYRISAVSNWHPELAFPEVSTDALLAAAGAWLPAFITSASTAVDLKKIDLQAAILSMLSYEQQQAVEHLAPTHLTVPTGSRIRLEYRAGGEPPLLRVRLQECFGLLDTPRIDGGRRPVLMELLSPGYKPVQRTGDLRSFWTGTYFEVRKELRRRYPKHAWPEDPLSAAPVRGTRR